MKNNHKIIIVRPNSYSGGAVVLSALCSELRKLKVDSSLFYIPKSPRKGTNMFFFWCKIIKLDILFVISKISISIFSKKSLVSRKLAKYSFSPVEGVRRRLNPFISSKDIVLYPEMVYGNFLHAKNVVRWLLYTYKYEADPMAYSKNDLFICYREVFNNEHLNPKKYYVQINYFNHSLYRQYNFGERKGICFVIRKGYNRKDLPKQLNGPVIDNLSEEDKVKVLNQCKYCYFYDTQTFYTSISAVCGCIPIVIMEPGKTIQDYRGGKDNPYGIAYGNSPEQIQYAIETREQRLKFVDFSKPNHENTLRFLQIIKEKFNIDFLK